MKGKCMQDIQVTDPDKMRLILETFAGLDEIRWGMPANYNSINYCTENLSADEKLLTHWLSYIMDRQMPFQRVWDIGGYVVSHLVRRFSSDRNRSVDGIVSDYIRGKDEGKVYLECPHEKPANGTLALWGITGDTVPFSSRYPPEDGIRIYRTLCILDTISGRSMAHFLERAIGGESNHARAIKKMAYALDAMTYSKVGKVTSSNFSERMKQQGKATADFTLNDTCMKDPFDRKRLWCSLREYLKSPEFNDVFVAALREIHAEAPEKWHRSNKALKSALGVLELPGDVWNNSELFRDGLFRPYFVNEPKSWDMPRTVRKIYNLLSESGPLQFYPEQLDVSFDFVPRMCERNMCDVCFFGEGIERTCHNKAGVFCPVALYSCGYRYFCDPDKCRFRLDSVKGLCKKSVAR